MGLPAESALPRSGSEEVHGGEQARLRTRSWLLMRINLPRLKM